MRKITPVYTEKSFEKAQSGVYTFVVDKNLTKDQIKELVTKAFGVTVASIRTIRSQETSTRTWTGKKKVSRPTKKAMVTLKGKDKIDAFEEASK